MRQTPNFSNWRATVLHRADANTERLSRHLRLLGFLVDVQWAPLPPEAVPELVLVDADQGYDGLLPWRTSEAAPCPLVALLGSEAPSRIAWALEQGAGALLSKPLNTSAVYPALVMAIATHAERQAHRAEIQHLEERLKLKPVVHAAVKHLVAQRAIAEDEAFGLLRASAMQQRLPIETVAASVLTGALTLPEAG